MRIVIPLRKARAITVALAFAALGLSMFFWDPMPLLLILPAFLLLIAEAAACRR